MDIAGGQQFPFARLEPASARVALAPRAVPVSAGVVGDPGRMSAAGAAIAMAAEHGGAAAHDGKQHLLVLPVDPLTTAFDECLSSTANNVGHLHEALLHGSSKGRAFPLPSRFTQRCLEGERSPGVPRPACG